MILASNRSFAKWVDIFCDPVVATALCHAVVIHEEGASFRLRGWFMITKFDPPSRSTLSTGS